MDKEIGIPHSMGRIVLGVLVYITVSSESTVARIQTDPIILRHAAQSSKNGRQDPTRLKSLIQDNRIPDGAELISRQPTQIFLLPFFDDFESGPGTWRRSC